MGIIRNEAVEVAEYVQKLAGLLRVLRVGQITRGKLCLEGFVNAVQAIHSAAQWPDTASSCFDGGSNSPVQFGPYVPCAHLPAPVGTGIAH